MTGQEQEQRAMLSLSFISVYLTGITAGKKKAHIYE